MKSIRHTRTWRTEGRSSPTLSWTRTGEAALGGLVFLKVYFHQFWWGSNEISTSFGGRVTKSTPVLVGESRNLHYVWWATRVISTNHGDRPQKNKPPGYRHRDMTSTQSCAALKSPFPQAIIKCVIVFLQPAAFRDKQAACQTTGGRR